MDHLSNTELTTKSYPRKKFVQTATADYGDIHGGATREPLTNTWALDKLLQASIIDSNAQPPTYLSLCWDQQIITAVDEFRKILPQFGIELGSLRRTEVTIVIDDNHRYDRKQVFAISILAGVLIPLLNSLDVSASFVFMTHQNPERDSYDEDEQEFAKFLDTLYVMDSPSQIKRAVNASESIKTQRPGGGEKRTTLKEEIQKIWDNPDIQPRDRLGPIISLIRDFRYDFTEPYKASKYDVQKFKELFMEARASDEQQPHALSNLAFSIIRIVQQQRAAWNARQKDTTGRTTRKKTILITAEGIDKTPYKIISKELRGVEGGGSEISIQHIEFVNHTQKGPSRGQKLDDMQEGDADIYDYSRIDIDTFLDKFISEYAILKFLFSEEPSVDSLRFNSRTPFYGRNTCERTPAGDVRLPAKEDYRAVFEGVRSGISGYTVIPSESMK
jgi:hypothetical protein